MRGGGRREEGERGKIECKTKMSDELKSRKREGKQREQRRKGAKRTKQFHDKMADADDA